MLLTSLWWIDTHQQQPPTQRELATHAGTDAMMTSQIIRKLAARGFLLRTPDPVDARAQRLQITDAGRALTATAIHDVEAADTKYFSLIRTPEQYHGFLEGLQTLANSQARWDRT